MDELWVIADDGVFSGADLIFGELQGIALDDVRVQLLAEPSTLACVGLSLAILVGIQSRRP